MEVPEPFTGYMSIDELIENAGIYHNGIRVHGIFYTWEELDDNN